MDLMLYFILTIALIVLSVIDIRTHKIPDEINLLILVLGIVRTLLNVHHWQDHLIGFFVGGVPLGMILFLSKGRAIGGGDVKLMAAAGLLLGWKKIILALFLGCFAGSVIQMARMKVTGAKQVFAFGPYLSFGIFVSALWGDSLIAWYLM